MTAVVALAAGGRHSCALNTSSLVLCWGANTQGQLGSGSTTTPNPPAPTVVLLSAAEAEALVRRRGDVLEEPVWTRAVRLTP